MSRIQTQFLVPPDRIPLREFLASTNGEIIDLESDAISNPQADANKNAVCAMTDIVNPVDLRQKLNQAGIDVPEHLLIVNESDLTGPVHLNPPFVLRSGRQSRFIQYAADAVLAYLQLKRSTDESTMVLEHGSGNKGIWVFGFLVEGSFSYYGSVELEWLDETYRFPMSLTAPAQLSSEHQHAMEESARLVAEALDLNDGPVRIEFTLDEADENLRVTEVDAGWFTASMPVDLFESCGMGSYWQNQLRMLHGDEVVPPEAASCRASLQWLYSRSGIVKQIMGTDEAREMAGITYVELRVEIGENLGHVLNVESRDRLGYLVATGEDAAAAQEIARHARDRIYIWRKTVL